MRWARCCQRLARSTYFESMTCGGTRAEAVTSVPKALRHCGGCPGAGRDVFQGSWNCTEILGLKHGKRCDQLQKATSSRLFVSSAQFMSHVESRSPICVSGECNLDGL